MRGAWGSEMILERGAFVIQDKDIIFPPGLDYGSNESFVKTFIMAYTKLLEDSPLNAFSPKPLRLMKKFFFELVNTNLSERIKHYSSMFDSITRSEYTTGPEGSTSFFLDDMRDTPVFKEYLTWRRTGQPELLKYVLSFLSFGKKLDYEDEQFYSNALRDWYGVEEKLHTLEFDPEDVGSLFNIISALLPRLNVSYILPRFGPGKVSERSIDNVYDKIEQLAIDRRLRYVFHRPTSFRLDDGMCGDLAQSLRDNSICVSRVKFAHKDMFKARTICMEPNGYMAYQQEVLRALQSSMEDGLISMFVNMNDQVRNQYAAIHGSQYLSSDTIDLSSASDSVHVDLVKRIFPRDYLFYLLGTRTSKVLVPDRDEPISVKKFAPMGSACCFPVQCIIFTAVCIYSYMMHSSGLPVGDQHLFSSQEVLLFIRSHLHKMHSDSSPFSRKFEPPLVYGDDIICDSRITDSIVATLSRLGFSVNVQKSFTGSQSFRESCGVYAWRGQDVTPVRFRAKSFDLTKDKFRWDANSFASLVEAINNLNDNKYHKTAGFLLSILKHNTSIMPKFTIDRNVFGIWTRNKHPRPLSALRWNADWQVTEEMTLGIVPRKSKALGKIKDLVTEKRLSNGKIISVTEPRLLESYKLVQWWRSRVSSEFTLPQGRGLLIRPQETRVAAVWSRCEE